MASSAERDRVESMQHLGCTSCRRRPSGIELRLDCAIHLLDEICRGCVVHHGVVSVDDLVRQACSRVPRLGATRLVAIDGPGGAGKSTLAALLAETCHGHVLHTDDFASWENPLDWWCRLEEEVLRPVAAGRIGRYQRYDWNLRALAEWHTVTTGGVLILEGVSSSRAAVRERLTLSIWVETPRHIRLARGLARDGGGAKTIWEQWMNEEDVHFASDRTREHADAIVCGT